MIANIGSIWSIMFCSIVFSVLIGVVWAKEKGDEDDNNHQSN